MARGRPKQSLTLNARVTGGTPIYTYQWSNGSNTSAATVSPTSATSYMVTATDLNGCVGTATKAIAVIDVRAGKKLDKVAVCHKNKNSLETGSEGVSDHLNHGDMLGACNGIKREVLENSGPLAVIVYPNPATDHFILNISTANTKDRINIRVFDALGKQVEQLNKQGAQQTLSIGSSYFRGIYFAEVQQGTEKVILKLMKK